MGDSQKLFCCILFILAGLFSIAGAVFNWDFYFNARKARTIVNIFGRNGARIFYAVLGLFIIFCGVMVLTEPA